MIDGDATVLADGLVVVDVQAGFVTGPSAVPGARDLVAAVDELLRRARAAGVPVIHLRNDGPVGALDERGAPGWELHRPPGDGESVVDKAEDDGFAGTGLGDELDRRGVRRPVLCGVQSEMCVAATARTALARGYGVVLPHTAHATHDVPAGPGGGPPVPAHLAARAAEWSIGDGVEIVATPEEVRFAAVPPPERSGGGSLVVVTGPPGVGKSTVATAVHDRLGDAGVANALIEVDELERCYPPRDEDDVMADLAVMAGRYRAGGHDLLFVTATVEDDAYAERILAAAGAASTLVVRLEADPGTLARRIREREPVGWSGTEDLVTHARCLAVGMADLARVDLVLSTDDTAVDALAARVEDLVRSRHR